MQPDTIVMESGEISKQVISSWCPFKVIVQLFIRGSQTLMLVSKEPDTTYFKFLIIVEHFDRCPENFPETIDLLIK
jgi:hypothetical protein